jgi:hypothetical protein
LSLFLNPENPGFFQFRNLDPNQIRTTKFIDLARVSSEPIRRWLEANMEITGEALWSIKIKSGRIAPNAPEGGASRSSNL